MNRTELLEIYKRHFYIENPHLIDIIAATYLTRTLSGDPVWLIPMAPSGHGKTEMSRPYMGMGAKDCFFWDQLTAKAFASGGGGKEKDYGEALDHCNSFAIIPDMANITSMDEDSKKQLFAVLRTMFDGYIKRATGVGKPEYDGIHVNLIGLSTSAIERDLGLGNLMGTREIMYRLPVFYCKEAVLNCKSITDTGRNEVARATRDYLREIDKNPFAEPTETEQKRLKEIVNRMVIWRAEGETDEQGYLLKAVEVESPKRLYTQITKLWMGLIKFGLSKEEAFKRVEEIERGMGNQLRERVYRRLSGISHDPDADLDEGPLTLAILCEEFNVGESEVRKNLMVLRSLGRIKKAPMKPWGYGSESLWYV